LLTHHADTLLVSEERSGFSDTFTADEQAQARVVARAAAEAYPLTHPEVGAWIFAGRIRIFVPDAAAKRDLDAAILMLARIADQA
jgi:hypothetical protein